MSKFLVALVLLSAPVLHAAPWKTQNVPASKVPGLATVSFEVKSRSSQTLDTRARISFLDAKNAPISNSKIFGRASNSTSWSTFQNGFTMPAGTRAIKVAALGKTCSIRNLKVTYSKVPMTDYSGEGKPGCPTGKENVPSSNLAFEAEVFRLTNLERVKIGVPALIWNDDLARAARYHANDMRVDNYFDHDTYDRDASGNLIYVCKWCWREWYFTGSYAGENIATGQSTPEAVVAAWVASPVHYAVMTRPEARQTAVGYVGGYWVQDYMQ